MFKLISKKRWQAEVEILENEIMRLKAVIEVSGENIERYRNLWHKFNEQDDLIWYIKSMEERRSAMENLTFIEERFRRLQFED